MPQEITQSSAESARVERPTGQASLQVVLVPTNGLDGPVFWTPRRQTIIERLKTAIAYLIKGK
jgi:hypothetical protein